jgi:hypothetical protein
MTFNYRPLLERLSAPICRRVIHVRGARIALLSEDPTWILPPQTWEVTPTPKLISLGVLTAVTAPKTDGFGRTKRISSRPVDSASWIPPAPRLFGRGDPNRSGHRGFWVARFMPLPAVTTPDRPNLMFVPRNSITAVAGTDPRRRFCQDVTLNCFHHIGASRKRRPMVSRPVWCPGAKSSNT